MFVLIAHTFDGDEIQISDTGYGSRSSARRARRAIRWKRDWAEVRCTRIA
jgi:hypothetical protein